MSDDLSNKGPQDRHRIDVNEQHEMRYWSEKFHVSHDELKAAVQRVGPMVKDVQQHLSR